MGVDGTPRALGGIARKTLAWVAEVKAVTSEAAAADLVTDDSLRRIELCARAALDISHFHDLYEPPRTGRLDFIGGDPHATAAEIQDER